MVPLSYISLPRRPVSSLLQFYPETTDPYNPTSVFTLANFLNRQPRTSHCSCHRANSQPPNRNTTNPAQSSSNEPPLFFYNHDIPRINQANPNKPLFPSITAAPRPAQGSCTPQNPQAQPMITTKRLYNHRPEEIYISSVLPMRIS